MRVYILTATALHSEVYSSFQVVIARDIEPCG